MVQTEQQYICIHQCLLAVLEGKENISSSPREIHDNQGYEGKSACLKNGAAALSCNAESRVFSFVIVFFFYY